MAKLDVYPQSWGTRYWFYCQGCRGGHSFDCRTDGQRPSWSFSGDFERPTFTPSLHVTVGPMPLVPEGRPDAGKIHVCHLLLTDGRLQFLSDCTHDLAGQTVELPEVD